MYSNGLFSVGKTARIRKRVGDLVFTRHQIEQTVAKVLVNELFFKFGVCKRIHSDQGKCYSTTAYFLSCEEDETNLPSVRKHVI